MYTVIYLYTFAPIIEFVSLYPVYIHFISTPPFSVPPKASRMSLPGTNQDGTATIDEGTEHTFTCLVQGTRPAASIKWFLNGEMQYTGTVAPPSVDDNELYDTTGSWSFTPSRDNHRQEILCQASTAESQVPLPNVTAILNVNGMYTVRVHTCMNKLFLLSRLAHYVTSQSRSCFFPNFLLIVNSLTF